MLKIRPAQMLVFKQAALKQFENEVVAHLREFNPNHCEALGDEGIRKVVRLGFERAKPYGFTNRGPLLYYLDMMFMFGSYFDTDPQFPWATQILSDPKVADQMARADCLYARTADYLEKVAGPDSKYALESLRRVRQQRLEDMPVAGQNFKMEMLTRLEKNYPQKYYYLGERTLGHLILRGMELAEQLSIADHAGASLCIWAMYILGHGFAADPLFPWIETTLKNRHLSDPDKRIERLYSRFMTYLDHALAGYGR